MYGWNTIVNSRSRSFGLFVGAFCIGVGVSPLFPFLHYDAALGLAIIFLASALLFSSRSGRAVFLIGMALFLGMSRYSQSLPPERAPLVSEQIGRSVRVQGVVNGEVEQREDGQRAVLSHILLADEQIGGRVLVFFEPEVSLHHGDTAVFSCRLATPEPMGTFRYDRYLWSRNILAICYEPLYTDVIVNEDVSLVRSILGIKERVVRQLSLLVPEPHASFLSGLVFGGSTSLSSDMRDDFSRTGTSHILAASGFNVSLFTAIFLGWMLSSPIGRRRALWITALLLCVYVIMAGATPAVLRAALMASLVLVGKGIRRQTSLVNALLLAGALLLLLNPRILLFDVGFQLSFIATAALVFVAPKWEAAFAFLPSSFQIRESFVASLAAMILTLPIVLWHFGSISLIAPVVNLLVLPVVPLLMAITMLALAVSVFHLSLGVWVALPAWALSSLLLHLVLWFSSLPFASVTTEHSAALALCTAVAFFAAFLVVSSRQYARSHISP